MTKAANIKKRRAHRGRPADEDCERTASGRKSRSNPAPTDGSGKPMSHVVLEARRRVLGVAESKAADPHASTALGRLWLSSAITTPMREAGERYLELYNAAMNALKAPVGLRKTNASGDGGDIITEEYVEWAIRAVAHYEAIKDSMTDDCRIAVHALVIEDRPPASLFAAQLGLLALAEKLGLPAS